MKKKETKRGRKQKSKRAFLFFYYYIYSFFLRELGQLERVDSIGVDLVRLIWLG